MNNNGKKQFASNNKYPGCPPRMADGRHFTDYRPNTDINNMIRMNNDIINNYTYRNFLTDNAEKIMKINDKLSCDRNCCSPCTNNNNYDVSKRLASNNKFYNLNKQSENQVNKLANKLMSNMSNTQHNEPKPLDNSYDYCAFGLAGNRTKYNKASGENYNE